MTLAWLANFGWHILNILYLPFGFMYSLLWAFYPSAGQSSKNDLDRETTTKILRPLYLLFAASEAAEAHLRTADTKFLNRDITVYIPGDSSEMDQILKEYKAPVAHVKNPKHSLFSKTICSIIRGLGQCQNKNKVIYVIASTILTWCICTIQSYKYSYAIAGIVGCVLGMIFTATSGYVHNSPPTRPVPQGHRIVNYQGLMSRAMKSAGIRYVHIRPLPYIFNGDGILEHYQIQGLEVPKTGITFREIYVTHFCSQEIFIQRPMPGKTLWPGRELAIPHCDTHNVCYGRKSRAQVEMDDQDAIMNAFVDSWNRLDKSSTVDFYEPGISDKYVDFYFDVSAV
ncbi:hypothetical protein BO78DRAFT_424570 [Aspergillus sclerotiicarbonarius CBS 121057]|uniref:Uncharacterized protein n=1 Tax=Aspergillus sclerotiicarbonarius (strain CBS 121057 / IBT 28362) TaxID=1448318 RepID=A0A319F5E4_ASPSB|nr:hypothetical protein BO78DRAFT_424570 [Aspergillus sclerotiicarbonarius CBS 121057]